MAKTSTSARALMIEFDDGSAAYLRIDGQIEVTITAPRLAGRDARATIADRFVKGSPNVSRHVTHVVYGNEGES